MRILFTVISGYYLLEYYISYIEDKQKIALNIKFKSIPDNIPHNMINENILKNLLGNF